MTDLAAASAGADGAVACRARTGGPELALAHRRRPVSVRRRAGSVGDRRPRRRVSRAPVPDAGDGRCRVLAADRSPARCRATPPRRWCACSPASRSPRSVGVVLGILMGRIRWVEDMALPLVSIGAPIPGLAYAPIFLMWFGLGNLSVILLVGVVAAFPIILNTWIGREGRQGDLGSLGAGDGRRRPLPVRQGDPAGRAALHHDRAAGSASRRRGASWSASRCWRPCRGASAG